jgi:hypothetical protein
MPAEKLNDAVLAPLREDPEFSFAQRFGALGLPGLDSAERFLEIYGPGLDRIDATKTG